MQRIADIACRLLFACFIGAHAAAAQDYPSAPVRIISGFSPGSTADITARVVGARMGQILGQQFVTEDRTGAASSIAAAMVARAPKDGYTLYVANAANIINAAMSSNSFLRHHQGFRSHRAAYLDADRAGGQPAAQGQQRGRAGRARESKTRCDLVRVVRGGKLYAPCA